MARVGQVGHRQRAAGDRQPGQLLRLRQLSAALQPHLDLRQLDPRRTRGKVQLGACGGVEQAVLALGQQRLGAGPVLPLDRREHREVVIVLGLAQLARRGRARGKRGEIVVGRLRCGRRGAKRGCRPDGQQESFHRVSTSVHSSHRCHKPARSRAFLSRFSGA